MVLLNTNNIYFVVNLQNDFWLCTLICIMIWASSQEKLSSVVCEQQRHKLACAYAKADQRLCYFRIGKYHISPLFKRISINVLACLCR